MNKLTVLQRPPAAAASVAPHQYRRLGEKMLITDELGRWALLTPKEYQRFLGGLKRSDPLWPRLQSRGFIADAFDFDAAARLQFERGLLSWKGPATHVLLLERDGKSLGLEMARRVVDFIFRCPGSQLTLELVCGDSAAHWPVIWFIVQYARRKGEWSRRPVFLILRCRALWVERAEFLRGHGVTRCLDLEASGSPRPADAPSFRAQSARLRLAPGARNPGAWADWLNRWGFESVRLLAPSQDEAGATAFLSFYGGFLDWLIAHGEGAVLREEWATSLLGARLWNLPGADLLEQLAYGPDGRVFSSEQAALGEGGLELDLGAVGELRYQDLARHGAARAVVAASHPDNQPLCGQCVYRAFCAAAPSLSRKSQGTLWGQTPSSAACSLQMGVLDLVFARFVDEKWLLLLDKWGVDMT